MNVTSDIRNEVMDKVEETLNVFRAKGHNIPTPTVIFRQMGRRSGECLMDHITKSCTLTINPDFFLNYHEDMINQTVPHEVVHYASCYVYGRAAHGHGFYWKMMMRQVDLKPSRCHSYSLDGVKVRKSSIPTFKYLCGCSEPRMVTQKIHTKIQEYGRHYTCRKCHKRIVYHLQVNAPAPALNNVVITAPVPVNVVIPSPVETVVVKVNTPNLFNVVTPPTPPAPKTEEPTYRIVTRFVNGSLTNVRIPVTA